MCSKGSTPPVPNATSTAFQSATTPSQTALPYYQQFLAAANALGGTPFDPATLGTAVPMSNEQLAAGNALFNLGQYFPAAAATAGNQMIGVAGAGQNIGNAAWQGANALGNQVSNLGFGAMGQAQPAINMGFGAMGQAQPAINMGFGAMGQAQPAINMGFGAMGQAAPVINLGMGAAANAQPIANLGMGAGQWDPAQVQAIMSPYTQDVVGATQNWFNNQNAIQGNQLLSQAIASGNAFGGDRAGIAQAQLAGQQQLAQAPVIAGLYQAGYGQALDEFNKLRQLGLSGGQLALAAQQLGLTGGQLALQGIGTGLQGAQLGLQGIGTGLQGGQLGLQGIGTGLQGGQLGLQGIGTGLQGGQLALGGGQLGLQGAGMGLQGQQLALGAEQANLNAQLQALQGPMAALNWGSMLQQQQQRQTDVAQQNALMRQAYPFQIQNWLGSALGAVGPLTGTQALGYTTPPPPNPLAQGLGIFSALAGGVGSLFGKDGGPVGRARGGPVGGLVQMRRGARPLTPAGGGLGPRWEWKEALARTTNGAAPRYAYGGDIYDDGDTSVQMIGGKGFGASSGLGVPSPVTAPSGAGNILQQMMQQDQQRRKKDQSQSDNPIASGISSLASGVGRIASGLGPLMMEGTESLGPLMFALQQGGPVKRQDGGPDDDDDTANRGRDPGNQDETDQEYQEARLMPASQRMALSTDGVEPSPPPAEAGLGLGASEQVPLPPQRPGSAPARPGIHEVQDDIDDDTSSAYAQAPETSGFGGGPATGTAGGLGPVRTIPGLAAPPMTYAQRLANNPLWNLGIGLLGSRSPYFGVGLATGMQQMGAAAQRSRAQDLLDRKQQMVEMEDGTLGFLNPNTGQVTPTGLPSPAAKQRASREKIAAEGRAARPIKIGEDKYGAPIMGLPDPKNPGHYIDPITQEPITPERLRRPGAPPTAPTTPTEPTEPPPPMATPSTQVAAAAPLHGMFVEGRTRSPDQLMQDKPIGTNPKALEGEDEGDRNAVIAMAEGRAKIPSATTRNRRAQYQRDLLFRYLPGFDETTFATRQRTATAFAVGPEGRKITAVNTFGRHLETLWDINTKLQNSKLTSLNQVSNALARQWGYNSRQELLAEWDFASTPVADEAANVFATGGGAGGSALADREYWRKLLSAGTPLTAMQKGLGALVKQVDGRLEALVDQYNFGMHTNRSPTDFVRPSTARVFEKIRSATGATAPPSPRQPQQRPQEGARRNFDEGPATFRNGRWVLDEGT